MIPSARPQPNSISASTDSQTVLAAGGRPGHVAGSSAGQSTLFVAFASASVSSNDDTANTSAPANDTKNGLGCKLECSR